nr:cytochrome c [uncultured Arsenicibacter sp.]
MKKAIRIVVWIIGGIAVIIFGIVSFIAVRGVPTYEAQKLPDYHVDVTPARIERGAKIAQLLCIQCHRGEGAQLTGKLIADAPKDFGQIYSANITQDKEAGIGTWTDGQLAFFLRTGIQRDGSYNPLMPKFPNMADEDLKSVIAWLHSDRVEVQPTKEEAPKTEYNFLIKALTNTVMKPYPYPQKAITVPDSTDRVAFGRYIANGMVGCYACHSADFKALNDIEPEKSLGFYGGGNPMLNLEGELVPSANITFDDETGIGKKYTEEQFIKVVKQGARPDGSVTRYPMVPHVTLTDYEVGSIYQYLKTIPKIKNKVSTSESGAVAQK